MKTQSRDLLVLIDSSPHTRKAIESLTFIPPLRVRQLLAPPDPKTVAEEPLLYLLGQTDALPSTESISSWLDDLHSEDAAPVAILVPRKGFDWCSSATHPQFCGLLPCVTHIPIEAMERILNEARQALARRCGRGMLRQARISWTLPARDAADSEQSWLLIQAALDRLIGSSTGLSCLGMAFSEAMTNAVEHGTLELDNSLKDGTDDGLFRFFEERERRLCDPRYGRRRIHVLAELEGSRIRVRIRNQGRGFDPSALERPTRVTAENSFPHGMGLSMIHSLVDEFTISPDGRTISLLYQLPRERTRPQGVMPTLLADEAAQRPAA